MELPPKNLLFTYVCCQLVYQSNPGPTLAMHLEFCLAGAFYLQCGLCSCMLSWVVATDKNIHSPALPEEEKYAFHIASQPNRVKSVGLGVEPKYLKLRTSLVNALQR